LEVQGQILEINERPSSRKAATMEAREPSRSTNMCQTMTAMNGVVPMMARTPQVP
jgi:hypothetical protein